MEFKLRSLRTQNTKRHKGKQVHDKVIYSNRQKQMSIKQNKCDSNQSIVPFSIAIAYHVSL